MKKIIEQLNKAFENRIRLGIMSILAVNDAVEFSEMKRLLNITDGNLASHIVALEKLNYVNVKKQFVGKKPNTTYSLTRPGRKAFTDHIDVLEKIIQHNK